MKIFCNYCHYEKEISFFHSFKKDKKCQSCYAKEYALKNPEIKKQAQLNWKKNNKDKLKQYSRDNYSRNKVKTLLKAKENRLNNLEKYLSKNREYKEKNKEKLNRQAREKYAQNRKSILINLKEKRTRDKEEIAAYNKKYQFENKERLSDLAKKRYNKKMENHIPVRFNNFSKQLEHETKKFNEIW